MIDYNNLDQIKLMNTVGANMKLADLCPGKNLKRLSEIVDGQDSKKSFETMMDIIVICNEAAEEFEKIKNQDYEMQVVTKEELMYLTEEQLGDLCLRAFGKIKEDAKTSIEIEPIKNAEAEEVEST